MARKYKSDKYRFGNYDKYYTDRNCEKWNDPRMKVFEKDWFQGKDVIDLGCNDGTLTILIACNLNPKSITGVEIDHRLINRAVESCVYIEKCRKQLLESADQLQALEEFQEFPLSFRQYLKIPNHVLSLTPLIRLKNFVGTEGAFPSNISFENLNALDIDLKADTVLCLSTVKWIHLNWGDQGVKDLFRVVYKTLTPGGVFVFEPQDWKSYKKSKVKSGVLSKNFSEIVFRPEEFHEFLIGLGFVLVNTLTPSSKNENFNRDIFVYKK